MKSVSRGIIALVMVSAILLLSDLQNQHKLRSSRQASDQEKPETGKRTPYRLALVHFAENPFSEDSEKGIRKALADKNLLEGTDFNLRIYNAQGDISTLNSIAGAINSSSPELVFTTSTPTAQMLQKKVPHIKIVFTCVGDPIAAGFGKSFEDHLPNLCGICTMSDFEGMMNLLKHLQPGIRRIGTVFSPAEVNSVAYKDRLSEAAKKQGIELTAAPANTAGEVLDAANSLAANRIDAFCQISDNLTGSSISAILKTSSASKIPFYGFVSGQLELGAVAVCARDFFQAGYEAGEMGLEVLSGKDPAHMPFRLVRTTVYRISAENARLFNIPLNEQLFKTFPSMKVIGNNVKT